MSRIEKFIQELYDEMESLKPTPQEIDLFIGEFDNPYGVVTYSTYDNHRGGNSYFMSVHDNHHGHKHYHIDLGYVNFDIKYNNVTQLMLDKFWAARFNEFIKEVRIRK